MSMSLRNPVTRLSVLWAVPLVLLALATSLVLPILGAAPAGGANVTTHKTSHVVIQFDITKAPTTTTTTTPTGTGSRPGTGTTTALPTTTTETTLPSVILATEPRSTAATPPTVAFTGAPIIWELLLAALLIAAGGAILLARHWLLGRRRA
jgi:hypothetical protein